MDTVDTPPAFPSIRDFDSVGNGQILKWACLPLDQAFRILKVTEINCRVANGGGTRVSRIAELEDSNGIFSSVWLPGIVEKKLLTFSEEELESGCLFIRPLGSKVSESTGHTYHNFRILKN